MHMRTKITVAIPVYNDGEYLKESIDSILNQSFSDFELLIINDGSTDNCPEIIRSYTDPRIRVLTHPVNLGRPAARNDAIKHAQGEYLLWMDADDIALPELVAEQVHFLDTHPEIDICGINYKCFNEKDTISNFPTYSHYIKAYSLFNQCISNLGCCLRLSKIRAAGIQYDYEFLRAEDFTFFFSCQFIYNLKITSNPKVLVRYRFFTRSTTDIFHKKAIEKYILPFLKIPVTNKNIEKHAAISTNIDQACLSLGAQDVMDWLFTLYNAGMKNIDKKTTEEFYKIISQKIYRCIHFFPLTHIPLLQKKYSFLPQNLFYLLCLIFYKNSLQWLKILINKSTWLKNLLIIIFNKLRR